MPESYASLGKESREISMAIGFVVITNVSLERRLVSLFSAVGMISYQKAEAIFYSTSSAKARLDAIRALIPLSRMPAGLKHSVSKALIRAKELSDRRNDLVHGQLKMDNDGGLQLVIRKPATATPRRERKVSVDDFVDLANDNGRLIRELDELENDILFPVMRQSWTGKHPEPPEKHPPQTGSQARRKAT